MTSKGAGINPSRQLVEQRIRNRLIEYFESVVSYGKGSLTSDLNEVLNEWEDWVGSDHPIQEDRFLPSVYTAQEFAALLEVDGAWESICNATPKIIGDLSATLMLSEWRRFSDAAEKALVVLMERGRFSEEHEQQFG